MLLLFDNYDTLWGLGMWHERLILQMLGISHYAITFVTFSVTWITSHSLSHAAPSWDGTFVNGFFFAMLSSRNARETKCSFQGLNLSMSLVLVPRHKQLVVEISCPTEQHSGTSRKFKKFMEPFLLLWTFNITIGGGKMLNETVY